MNEGRDDFTFRLRIFCRMKVRNRSLWFSNRIERPGVICNGRWSNDVMEKKRKMTISLWLNWSSSEDRSALWYRCCFVRESPNTLWSTLSRRTDCSSFERFAWNVRPDDRSTTKWWTWHFVNTIDRAFDSSGQQHYGERSQGQQNRDKRPSSRFTKSRCRRASRIATMFDWRTDIATSRRWRRTV